MGHRHCGGYTGVAARGIALSFCQYKPALTPGVKNIRQKYSFSGS